MIKYFIEINEDGTPQLKSNIYTSRAATSRPLADITEAVLSGYSGSGKEKAQPRYYITTDISGKPVSGTLTTKKPTANNHIDITNVFNKNAVTNPLLIDENVLYAVIVVGHSIATDMSVDPRPATFQNVAFGTNKKVEWNDDNTAMRVVDCILSTSNDRLGQHIFQPATINGNNNPSVLLTNEIARLVNDYTKKNIQFISISGATNGCIMYNNGYVVSNPEIGNNSQWFQHLKQGLQTAKGYATSIGKTLRVAFVLQINGEGETLVWDAIHMDAELLKKNFVRYHRELRTMIAEVTGDSFIPKIYRHQQHMNLDSDLGNMRNKQAQLELTDPYAPIVFPMTTIDNGSGYEHPGTIGTFKYAGISANNIFRDTYQKKFAVFKPVSFSIAGNSIKMKCAVPVKPIRIDTSRGGTPVEQTFTLYDSLGGEIVITSVVVSGDDELTLNCAASPLGGTLYYKLKRPYLATDPYGRSQADITDSDDSSFYGIRTPSFLLSFKHLL